MHVDEITIEVRSLALGRLGQIDMRLVTDAKFIKRFNNVGAWNMSLPAEDPMTRQLAQKGRGITVEGPLFTLMSGRVLSWQLEQNGQDVLGIMKFQGVDDNVHLADAAAWPQPSNPDTETQTVGHDIRVGAAETVMKQYVNANIGPASPAARRIPEIKIAPDLSRGNVVSGRARYDKLGLLLSQLASPGVGNLGFDIMQVGTDLVFDVYEPQDVSALVRMDVMNDTLDSVVYGVSAPAETRAIVAGQGEMEDRRIIQVTDALSLQAEVEWGRKIEVFHDRRDVDIEDGDTELIQTGVEALEEGGRTLTALSVKPSDDQTMIYGRDWYLGYVVSVTVDEQPLIATVTEAIISIGANGVTVGATVGDPTGFDYESRMIAAQKEHEARLAFLEKNVETALIFDPSRIPNLPASKITSGVFDILRIPQIDRARLPSYFADEGRGTTAQRDALFGVPSTDAAKVSLANRRVQWYNTEKGYTESYYALSSLSGLTVVGLAAPGTGYGAPTSGWYPVPGTLAYMTRIKNNSFQSAPGGVFTRPELLGSGSSAFAHVGGMFNAVGDSGIVPTIAGLFDITANIYWSGGGAMAYTILSVRYTGGTEQITSTRSYGGPADMQQPAMAPAVYCWANQGIELEGMPSANTNIYGDGISRRTFLTVKYAGPPLAS